jgi:putative tricarboxylic transport membrane protein
MFIGRIFGGGWKGVTVAGAVLGTGLWFFFDKLLDVTLPLGRLWAGA